MLAQVPEYPVIPEKIDDEASDALPETSPYQEDGSLEVCQPCIAFLIYVCFLFSFRWVSWCVFLCLVNTEFECASKNLSDLTKLIKVEFFSFEVFDKWDSINSWKFYVISLIHITFRLLD
jgi:hypothetical protein